MAYFLYALFFISCIVLIASVLLQPGKTDAGALFTSNISSSAFNPRGTQTVLAKISIAAAITFMLSALLLAMPALTGGVSVLQTSSGDVPTETVPAITEQDANANVTTANSALQPNVTVNTNVVTGNTTTVNAAIPVANTNSNTAVVVNKATNK